MNEREYIRRVFETALFFRDMHEEGNDGQTTAIGLLKPIVAVNNKAVRQFVLHDLYKKQGLSLTEATLKLAAWQPVVNEGIPLNFKTIMEELEILCLAHEREMRDLSDLNNEIVKKEVIQRSFLRAARYIQSIDKENAPAHSRVVELFIPEDFVPRGHGKDGPGHREHVVPCVYLRDECRDRFRKGAQLEEIVQFLQRCVVIVEITKEQQQRLDGGCGLKNSMPEDWQPDTGCIFERLHVAEIEFIPPKGFSTCNH